MATRPVAGSGRGSGIDPTIDGVPDRSEGVRRSAAGRAVRRTRSHPDRPRGDPEQPQRFHRLPARRRSRMSMTSPSGPPAARNGAATAAPAPQPAAPLMARCPAEVAASADRLPMAARRPARTVPGSGRSRLRSDGSPDRTSRSRQHRPGVAALSPSASRSSPLRSSRRLRPRQRQRREAGVGNGARSGGSGRRRRWRISRRHAALRHDHGHRAPR